MQVINGGIQDSRGIASKEILCKELVHHKNEKHCSENIAFETRFSISTLAPESHGYDNQSKRLHAHARARAH